MKERISATIEKKTRDTIEDFIKSGKFRNISHVIERAVDILRKLEGEK